MNLEQIKLAFRVLNRARNVRNKGFTQYKGNVKEICRQIVKSCWNGTYFQASNGHFKDFWTRDFGFCTDSLLKQGYKKEIKKTLQYALDIFSRSDRVTTTISPKGQACDFPYYAPDSLAYLIRSLRLSKSDDLINKYKYFLNNEIKKYYDYVIDSKTGLVRRNRRFSSMKDFSIRKSSCYDNCVTAMLADELRKIKVLNNPFKKYDFKKIIKENFWINCYFIDDLSGDYFITGDANVFPFYFKIFNEKEMIKSAISKIRETDLDKPFPLRYYHYKNKKQKMIIWDKVIKNYERDTVWCHLGLLYIKIVNKVNKKYAKHYIDQYKKLVQKNKNFLEIFDPDGEPYGSFFYSSDESMLWASILLELSKTTHRR